MSYEGYASALKARRGNGMDMSAYSGIGQSPETPQAMTGPAQPQSLQAQPQTDGPAELMPGQPAMMESAEPQLAPTQAGAQLSGELDDEVSGNATREEWQRLSQMNPRSLGERAKMDVLKRKYGGGQ